MTSINPEIQSMLKEVSKKFGQGSAMILSEAENLDIERVSSGSLNLDLALGGGFPVGRTVELFGPESSGKTTIALFHAVEQQRKFPDKYVLFIDLEHAIDPKLMREYGIDDTHLIMSQPDTAEDALDLAESFIRTDTVSLVIIDSVSALIPSVEAESSIAAQQMGLQARLMSKALRKLTPVTSKHSCTVIFINQIREKIGVMYGNPETTSGGRSLSFYASVRVNIRAGERIPGPGGKDDVIGHLINAKVVKNKTALPYKVASFKLFYGKGVDTLEEVVDMSAYVGFICKAGAYLQFREDPNDKETTITRKVGDEEIKMSFQGKDNFVEYLRKDDALYEILNQALRTGVPPSLEALKGNS